MKAHYLGHVVFYVKDLESSLGWNGFTIAVLSVVLAFLFGRALEQQRRES